MASLIEELILVLASENKEYSDLVILSHEKTKVIVNNDIDYLTKITEAEQSFINRLNKLETKREAVVCDIANVLCQDPKKLTVRDVIDLLKGQPSEQNKLAQTYDELKTTLDRMVAVNELNKSLIQQSLELIDFDLNLLSGTYSGPETANYTKTACNSGSVGKTSGVFDAKQ